MKFILVRHTETEGNARKCFNGWTESPYTQRGLKMNSILIDALAEIHQKTPISEIYASPIFRARHIGEMLEERIGVPLIIEDALKEFNFGIFEGLTADEARTRDPALWDAWMADYNHVALKDGGCYAEYHGAIGQWLDHLSWSDDTTIVVVAHGGTVNSLLLHLLDLPMGKRWHFKVDLGGIVMIDAPERFGILQALFLPNYEDC